MTTGYRNSAGVDFDSLFDPYVQGTKPAATGYRTSDGVDLNQHFAPISVGTKGPDVGYRDSSGVDLSNYWAAAGTAQYPLACDGFQYNSQALTNAAISLSFDTASSWAINGITSTSPAGGVASGSLPTGASKYRLTVTESGTTSAISTAPTGTWASITSGLQLVGINLSSSTAAFATATIKLELQNASGVTISTTNLTLQAHTTGQ